MKFEFQDTPATRPADPVADKPKPPTPPVAGLEFHTTAAAPAPLAAPAAEPAPVPEPPPAPEPAAEPQPAAAPPAAPLPAEAKPPAGSRQRPSEAKAGGVGRIGDKLVEMGLISKDQLQVALHEKKRSTKLMGELLIDLGFITEAALSAVLADSTGFETFDPRGSVVDPELIKAFPKDVAQRHRVFPVSVDDEGVVRLAMADPYDVIAQDQARRYFPSGCDLKPMVCAESDILSAIDQYYGYELSIDGILREIETGHHDTSAAALQAEGGYLHPLVRLVNAILLDAIKVGASDIHFEPEGSFLRLRYRIDGVMQQIRTIHRDYWGAMSHRLKIVSGMNIADKLNPQDGRFSYTIGNRKIDFRVNALPTVHGENIVIRILDKSRALLSIDNLLFSESNKALLLKLLLRPEGIIIVTGPTGSGKTTTLYSVLSHINNLERNIMTLEDPVEYELPLIRQAQVREGTQLNFSDGVRALLRQDPDVIFIGEVRDQDTASMALRAAMTGHQVYSTLHTNDAAGALPRLIDLGLEPGLLAGNIIGILAQRLVRRLCDCREMRPATPEQCRILGANPANPPLVGHPVGCPQCRHSGYRGRVAVHEILPMAKELDEMVIGKASLNQIRERARHYGFIPMAEDGIAKVVQGMVSLDALMRSVDVTERL